MSIQRYSNKEPLVFAWIAFPYIVFMNLLIFGICVWGSWITFGLSTIISSIYFSIIYAIFGRVAVVIKNTYPGAGDMFKRISIMLPVFYLMNIFSVQGIFLLYDYTGWISCAVSSGMTGWTILYACVMSTLITFINEGMANWQNWKDSLSKAEKLRNAYQRSKLLGLKGQMNPHFLFNCFNTLSGLIQENADRADCFLNEMIRVHRYLLRSDDAFLVSLSDEINYAKSYLNLAKTRFGEALIVEFNVNSKYLNRMLPPLSMQVILENIIYTNALNKKDPVYMKIETTGTDELCISHTTHEKIIVRDLNIDEGVENLSRRYKLLNTEINVRESDGLKKFTLPLFNNQNPAT